MGMIWFQYILRKQMVGELYLQNIALKGIIGITGKI